MDEDDYSIYRGDAAEILACMRHMVLHILRVETSRKTSVRQKHNIAGMSSEYLEKALNAGLKKIDEFEQIFTLSPCLVISILETALCIMKIGNKSSQWYLTSFQCFTI